VIKVSRLNVGYGQVQVLFDVSLESRAGECIGVLGLRVVHGQVDEHQIASLKKPSSSPHPPE